MRTKMFAFFDSKAAFFSNPYFDQREASAVRAFSDAVNDCSNPNNMLNKHPEDYSLFYLGEFDNETGAIDIVRPTNLVTASAVRTLGSNLPPELLDSINHKDVKALAH